MNDTLKQFSDELAKTLKAKIASPEFATFIEQVKASGDDRTFEVVMSTSDEDRQGDELDQSKWDLKYFDLNPVVLWAHNYGGFPIGIVTDIQIQGNKAIATGKFAPAGINPEADMACALYQQKILRAVSPGYIQNDDGTRELLELSFCPVPAGKFALSLRQVRALGVSTSDLVTKGFFFETKGAVPYADHGNADPDTAWDGPAEVKACGDDLNKLKAICAWFDSDNSDVKSAYKLPHHEASSLKAVLKGVEAAGAAINGARGGVDIPSSDIAAVKAHLAKHYKAFGKAPPWEEKTQKSPQIGDRCELDDGTPGVLAENDDDPGQLVCVPAGDDKSTKSDDGDMNNELIKKFKAEHGRHGKAVAKAIDEFKSIDEFKGEIDAEQETHLDNTVKAIDDSYETMGREENNKSLKAIDEFKSDVKAEHLEHVKAIDKSIEEFTKALPDDDPKDNEPETTKAIEEFTKSAGEELDRHEKTSVGLCEAAMGEGEEDEEKAINDAVLKIGAAISAKNKDKIKAVIKALEDHHEAFVADHQKSTTDVIASLKELMGSPQEDEEEKPDEKSGAAPKQKSSTPGAAPRKNASASEELEAYLLAQRLVRQVKTASENGLRQINEALAKFRAK